MIMFRPLMVLASLVTLGAISPVRSSVDSRPNFVVIFIDDMGYGDIEPFGSTENRTPHLRRMAEEGMRLTSFYVASPVCTPSRAALMTGCYPIRVGLAYGSDHLVLFPGDSHGLHPGERTLAELLQEAGYATGCFGKWHLGDQPGFLPTDQGFETYFGIPYSNDMWPHHPNKSWPFPPLPLMRDTTVEGVVDDLEAQGKLCQQFTEAAVQFIRENRERPFFVYLPHAFVHHPRHARDSFLRKAEEPGIDWEAAGERSGSREEAVKTRAQIEEVDWSVGEVLETLRALKLDRKTLVLFTSDNGGARGCDNGPLRGRKGTPFEGGMREPTLAWWPGSIPAGSANHEMMTTMDILPTFTRLAAAELPEDRMIDGFNIAPLLLGSPHATSPTKAFYYYQRDQLKAVRSGPWKYFASGELYHLEKDIGETRDVANQHGQVVAQMKRRLERARVDLGDGQRKGANTRPVGIARPPRTLLPRPGAPGEEAFTPTLLVRP